MGTILEFLGFLISAPVHGQFWVGVVVCGLVGWARIKQLVAKGTAAAVADAKKI